MGRVCELFGNGLFILYGEAGSGKTGICLQVAFERLSADKDKKGKIIFIDTLNSFSVERFSQIAGEDYKDLLERVLLFRVNSFKSQQLAIKKIKNIVDTGRISAVFVDTITYYYRRLRSRELDLANSMLRSQLRILKQLGLPVLVTSEVYKDIEHHYNKIVGGDIMVVNCNALIELKRNPRMMIFRLPKKEIVHFEIGNDGIKVV